MPKSRISVDLTTSIIGATAAISAMKTRGRRDMSRPMWSATRTWTKTATGVRSPATGTSGFLMYQKDGLLIVKGTGPGLIPGDGPGWTTNLGAMLPFTTAAGCRWTDAGVGCRDRWK